MAEKFKYVVDVPLDGNGYYRLIEASEPTVVAECVRILLTADKKRPHVIMVSSELLPFDGI